MRTALVLLLALLGALPAFAQAPPFPPGITPPVFILRTSGTFGGSVTTGTAAGAQFLCGTDGTAALPCYSWASEPALGFWRPSPTNVQLQAVFTTSSNIFSGGNITLAAAGFLRFLNRAGFWSGVDGVMNVGNFATTIGSQLKVDAVPTIASGFGTSAAVFTGSTPLAGRVDVGTGGVATTGTIAFNGTAFPSSPHCVTSATAGTAQTNVAVSATQMTLTVASGAWPASAAISWHCVSSK